MTHEERLALINKPFPPIGGPARTFTRSYPWAGTIIGDTFFGDGEQPSRHHLWDDDSDRDVLNPGSLAHLRR